MFADLPLLPADPILDLGRIFSADPRAHKINLGIGVYQDRQGNTPIMEAVAQAEMRLFDQERTKAYLPPKGVPGFAAGIAKLVLGDDHPVLAGGRCRIVQMPGGCGALRIGGGILARSDIRTLAVGSPTWPNHAPLLSAAGLDIRMIPYFDAATGSVDFDAFIAAARELGPSDVLLLHGACHNPTGADLSDEQVDALAEVAETRGFLPMIDTAYHGLADGIDEDASGVRRLAARLPELLVAYSCSKNFGLYRERTGALIMIGATPDRAAALESHALDIARETYSMAPAHGALLVTEILGSGELGTIWRRELGVMRSSIRRRRRLLAAALRETALGDRLDAVATQNGMFSLLPLTHAQTRRLRDDYAVHMAGSGRINVCGVRDDNAARLADAIAAVMVEETALTAA